MGQLLRTHTAPPEDRATPVDATALENSAALEDSAAPEDTAAHEDKHDDKGSLYSAATRSTVAELEDAAGPAREAASQPAQDSPSRKPVGEIALEQPFDDPICAVRPGREKEGKNRPSDSAAKLEDPSAPADRDGGDTDKLAAAAVQDAVQDTEQLLGRVLAGERSRRA
ncbi:Adenylate cyclase type 9, partial [Frankliniella fusca]